MFIHAHVHVCVCTLYAPTYITVSELHVTQRRYKILCAKKVKDGMDPKQASAIILDEIITPDQYRLGASKVLERPRLESHEFLF